MRQRGSSDSPPPEPPAEIGDEAPPTSDRGLLETLLQETIRRAVSLGLGGFFLTEEAVRRAFSDAVPQEWVEYLDRQSEDVRGELTDRFVSEFGNWLKSLDLEELLRGILDDYEFSANVELRARAKSKDSPASLEVVRRRK